MNKKNNQGFTLLELLITVGIFSMTVLMVSGIYVAFSKNQTRAKAAQTLLNNSQYTLEIISREIKNNEIFDYDPNNSGGLCGAVSCCNYYIGPDYESCILLQKPDGQMVAFVADLRPDQQKVFYVVPPGASYTESPWESVEEAYTKLLAPELNDVVLESLDFYFSPSTNPFVVGGPNLQPKVTINMNTVYDTEQIIAQVSYRLQTTISSRIYKR